VEIARKKKKKKEGKGGAERAAVRSGAGGS